MIVDNNEVTSMVIGIADTMKIDIPNSQLSDFQDEITKALLSIDITLYYQLLDLYESVDMVKKMVTKYNLLVDNRKKLELTEAKKLEIMAFILEFARKIGNEKYLYEKIERDLEFENGKQKR